MDAEWETLTEAAVRGGGTASTCAAPPLPGEIAVIGALRCGLVWAKRAMVPGYLYASSYRLRFIPSESLPHDADEEATATVSRLLRQGGGKRWTAARRNSLPSTSAVAAAAAVAASDARGGSRDALGSDVDAGKSLHVERSQLTARVMDAGGQGAAAAGRLVGHDPNVAGRDVLRGGGARGARECSVSPLLGSRSSTAAAVTALTPLSVPPTSSRISHSSGIDSLLSPHVAGEHITALPLDALPLPARHLPAAYYSIPIMSIRRLERSASRLRDSVMPYMLHVHCKDVRVWTLCFDSEATLNSVITTCALFATPSNASLVHGMAAVKAAMQGEGTSAGSGALRLNFGSTSGGNGSSGGGGSVMPGTALVLPPSFPTLTSALLSPPRRMAPPTMAVYNAYEELERLGLFSYREPGSKRALWRVSDANRAFGLCDTYPATLAFPDSVTDDTLAAAAAFRARARLPTLCWIHPQLKTSLWRSSQPAVGIVGSTSAADEVLLGEIRRCHPVTGGPLGANTPLVVADCRPAANAFANKAKGYGYETYSFTSVKFLDMHNIHRVRDAYNALEALILSTQPHAQHSSTRAHGEGAHKTASAAAVAMYTAAVSTVMGGSSGSSGGATPSTSSSILAPPSRTAAVDTRHAERSHSASSAHVVPAPHSAGSSAGAPCSEANPPNGAAAMSSVSAHGSLPAPAPGGVASMGTPVTPAGGGVRRDAGTAFGAMTGAAPNASLLALYDVSAGSSSLDWMGQVASTGWLQHVRALLTGGCYVAAQLYFGSANVLVHCSDGWDRTAQITSLAQLLLDPYYRTLRGFCVLIAKEWCSFGHCFWMRHFSNSDDVSPIFLLWLDAVHQLVRLYPAAFQFNLHTLLVIAHHLTSCRFTTFLHDSEKERLAAEEAATAAARGHASSGLEVPVAGADGSAPSQRAPMSASAAMAANSLWAYLLSPTCVGRLLNASYDAAAVEVLLPPPSVVARQVTLWSDWFLRFASLPSAATLPASMPVAFSYAPGSYDHARVATAATVALPPGLSTPGARAPVESTGATPGSGAWPAASPSYHASPRVSSLRAGSMLADSWVPGSARAGVRLLSPYAGSSGIAGGSCLPAMDSLLLSPSGDSVFSDGLLGDEFDGLASRHVPGGQ